MSTSHRDPGRKSGSPAREADLDVLVVGSANIDRTVYVARHPRPGETLTAVDSLTAVGGKGTNQAVGVAVSGGRVALVAVLGDDDDARMVRRRLVDRGVDVSAVMTVPERTGTAFIIVDEAGENTIVVVPGANYAIDAWNQLLARPLPAARCLLLQNELPGQVLQRLLTTEHPHRLTVLNLAPLTTPSDITLAHVDVLVVNEHEAAALLQTSPARSLDEAATAARRVRGLGPDVVVITLGARGALAADSSSIYHQPARSVPVLDTTGAGDSFTAALALALARRVDLPHALAKAAHAASLTVQHRGAQPLTGV